MTRIAIQVPVKWRQSERCAGKNFRELGGVPLCVRKLNQLYGAPENWDVFVDTENVEKFDTWFSRYHDQPGYHRCVNAYHERHPAYAENWCNGIQLLNQFVVHHPGYDWYCQAFVTAPFLRVETMVQMVNTVIESQSLVSSVSPAPYDSALTVAKLPQMVWHDGEPVNHDPRRMNGEMRTQDMRTHAVTHGFYVVRGDVARETGCRTGKNPLLWEVSGAEAMDIDTDEDFVAAERWLQEEKTG